MHGLSKTIFKAIAVTGALIIIGTAALVTLNNNAAKSKSGQAVKTEGRNSLGSKYIPDLPPLPDENLNDSGTSKPSIYGELMDASNPLIPDAFYKSRITILEKDIFEAKAQVSSTALVESTFTSEEILFYDNRTEKCYILGRQLTISGTGSVTVTHEGGTFAGNRDYDSSGSITELYGELIIKKIGDDISVGPLALFPPDSLTHADIDLIPGKSDIKISRTYSASESVLDDLTGRLVTPSGTFFCDLKRISEAEAMKDIAQFNTEIIDNESKEEFVPDLPPLPDENKDPAVDNVYGHPLPEGYPQDVLPISNDVFVAISETVTTESGKNGFAVTLKVEKAKEQVLKEYGNLLKNASTTTMNGVSTMAGEKGGYEYSIMIMDNSLGGSEKTMIQVMINPLED